jgi:hypothetical protein
LFLRRGAFCFLMTRTGELTDVEGCLVKALELWGDNIEALEEIAHFYDAVISDSAKAKHYAGLCRAKALELAKAMDDILKDN